MEDAVSRYTRIGSVRIAVSDSGSGMSQEQVSSILSSATSTNAAGVSIVVLGTHASLKSTLHAVQYHGGTLSIESSNGCTVILELPLYSVPRYILFIQF